VTTPLAKVASRAEKVEIRFLLALSLQLAPHGPLVFGDVTENDPDLIAGSTGDLHERFSYVVN